MMSGISVSIPVGRSKALTRALFWLLPASVMGVATVVIYSGLHWRPSGVSNRLVDYSIALVALPLPVLALLCAFKAVGWFLLCCWPRRVGIYADRDLLVFRLGPFGTRRFDAARLDVRYPFELDAEHAEGGFEAFLPEEQQLAELFPRITHPDVAEPLDLVILRFATGTQTDLLDMMRPVIDGWRTERSDDSPSEKRM